MAGMALGTSWWGRAWIDALEAGGAQGGAGVRNGRTLARRGAVHELELRPGHIAARVIGKGGELHDVDIAVRGLAAAEWAQVAEAISRRSGHLAALLDGELPPGIVEDAADVDVALLVRASDLRPDCSCDEWEEPCRHAAAACYVVAGELDRNPFALFRLRGIERHDLIAAVRDARPDHAASDRPTAVHDDAVHDDAVHDDAVHDDAAHDDAAHDDAAHDDAAHDDAAHDDAAHDDAVHGDDSSAKHGATRDAGAEDAMAAGWRGDGRGPSGERPGTPRPSGRVDGAAAWRGRAIADDLPAPPAAGTAGLRPDGRRGSDPGDRLGRPGPGPRWDAEPPSRHGIDPDRVDELASDAVQRAWSMLVDDRPSGLRASARADLARRVVAEPDRLDELASLAGVTPAKLAAWAQAWAAGGDDAVTVIADPRSWSGDQERLSEARDRLVELGLSRRSIALNYDSLRTGPRTWLVLGPRGRWYRLSGTVKHQGLELDGAPADSVTDLVDPPD